MTDKKGHFITSWYFVALWLGYAILCVSSDAQVLVPIKKAPQPVVHPVIVAPPVFRPTPIVKVPQPIIRSPYGPNTIVSAGPSPRSVKPTLSEPEPAIKQLRPETVAMIAAAASGPANTSSIASADIARAGAVLNRALVGQKAAMPTTPGLAAKLADAMMLGGRQQTVMPQLAALNDSLNSGIEAQRRAALALFRTANQSPPSVKALDAMLAKAQSVHNEAAADPQHGRIGTGSQRIEVDSSPAVGLDRVSVFLPNGPDNKPERVTFDGAVQTEPDAFGSNLQPAVSPEPARVVTSKESDDMRARVNGNWVDQHGEVWEITGEGDSVVFDDHYPGGHVVRYPGTWSLGLPVASHLVNDTDDMADDLPSDIKSQLASSYHPPFAIRLEYFPDRDSFEGLWISGQVTYSQWFGIKVVEDPTWDKRLTLARNNSHVAQGGIWPDNGP